MRNSDGATEQNKRYGQRRINRGYGVSDVNCIRPDRCLGCGKHALCLIEYHGYARFCERYMSMLWCRECTENGGYAECSSHSDGAFLTSHPYWLDIR